MPEDQSTGTTPDNVITITLDPLKEQVRRDQRGALDDVFCRADHIRDGGPDPLNPWCPHKVAADTLKRGGLPPWCRNEWVQELLAETEHAHTLMNPAQGIVELVQRCEELSHLDVLYKRPIRVVWWTGKRTKDARTLLGTAKPTSPKDRALWSGPGRAPWWTVSLSLSFWLFAENDEDRLRLLHHELLHCDLVVDEETGDILRPCSRGHDVEEFAATVARFGSTADAIHQIALGLEAHPTTLRRKLAQVDRGQLQLSLWDPYIPLTPAERRDLRVA